MPWIFFSGVSCRLKTPTVGEFLVRRNCRLSTVHTDWYGFYVAFVTWLWTVPWLFLNKNAWAFQWAYRSGEENTYIYIYNIYIYTYTYTYVYIYIPILFIHPRFFTQKLPIRFLFWMDFLFKKIAWLQPLGFPGSHGPRCYGAICQGGFCTCGSLGKRKAVQGGFSMGRFSELSGLPRKTFSRNGAD